jgi:hypothetical protein
VTAHIGPAPRQRRPHAARGPARGHPPGRRQRRPQARHPAVWGRAAESETNGGGGCVDDCNPTCRTPDDIITHPSGRDGRASSGMPGPIARGVADSQRLREHRREDELSATQAPGPRGAPAQPVPIADVQGFEAAGFVRLDPPT